MNNKAQAGLEYLVTYGWALILVATVIGVMVLMLSPTENNSFSSSDPTKIMIKGGNYLSGTARIKLQNITGSGITITELSGLGGNCNIDGETSGIILGPGEEMLVECTEIQPEDLSIPLSILYTDSTGLERTVIISINNIAQATPAILITECPYTITESGNYALANNLPTYSGTCIIINADDATLNCQNRTITGSGYSGFGIHLNSVENVTVKNCGVSIFSKGILVQDGLNNTLSSNNTSQNYDGIVIFESNNNTLNNNTSNESGVGSGIQIYKGNNNTLSNNTSNENQGRGILIFSGNNNILNDNTSNQNTASGIFITGTLAVPSSGNELNRNETNDNTGSGTSCGIRLNQGANNNILNYNNANRNRTGIELYKNTHNNILSNNQANQSLTTGVMFYESTNNTLNNNQACDNPTDIYCVSSSYSGSGNTATVNNGCAAPDNSC